MSGMFEDNVWPWQTVLLGSVPIGGRVALIFLLTDPTTLLKAFLTDRGRCYATCQHALDGM